MARNRIICIGNSYHPADSGGALTLAALQARQLPEDLAVIDGGLAGLGLLPEIEGATRVVFVDSLLNQGDAVRVIPPDDPLLDCGGNFGHSAGLGYLLRILPQVMVDGLPQLYIVAVPGNPDAGQVDQAAATSLALATGCQVNDPAGHGGAAR